MSPGLIELSILLIACVICVHAKKVNILLIVADDLGMNIYIWCCDVICSCVMFV